MNLEETLWEYRKKQLPVRPLYSKLIPLRTVVSMFAGSVFHHLYSYPRTGSVPAGQWVQSGETTRPILQREACKHPPEAAAHMQVAATGEWLLSVIVHGYIQLTPKHSDSELKMEMLRSPSF